MIEFDVLINFLGFRTGTDGTKIPTPSNLLASDSYPPALFISHGFHPKVGIGNLLFIYASLWGIAKKNHLTPTIRRTRLHDFMEIELPPQTFFDLSHCENVLFGREECCIYDEHSQSISSSNPSRNVSLWGYFQSHKYFHPEYREDIRRQMRFKPDVAARATAIIDKAVAQFPSFEFMVIFFYSFPNKLCFLISFSYFFQQITFIKSCFALFWNGWLITVCGRSILLSID